MLQGSNVRSAGALRTRKVHPDFQLFGIPCDTGGPKRGCGSSPRDIRSHGLIELLKRVGKNVSDHGDLSCVPAKPESHSNSQIHHLDDYAGWIESIFAIEKHVSNNDEIPVFLGGDHAISAGTIPLMAATARLRNRPFFVLWIDAHCDLNTLVSTESGNLHGTPLAYATGIEGFESFLPEPLQVVEPSNTLLVGIRDIDASEQLLLDTHEYNVATMQTISTVGLENILGKFLRIVAACNGDLHLSIDLDGFDPSLTPGVNTPVAGGLNAEDANTITQLVAQSGLITSVDVVELNPSQDPEHHTVNFALDILKSLFESSATLSDKKAS